MLASLTPFKETRAYQELVERERKGKIEGKIINLKELFEEGFCLKISINFDWNP